MSQGFCWQPQVRFLNSKFYAQISASCCNVAPVRVAQMQSATARDSERVPVVKVHTVAILQSQILEPGSVIRTCDSADTHMLTLPATV